MSSRPATKPIPSLSTDLEEMALMLDAINATGGEMTPLGVEFLANTVREFQERALRLEGDLRAAHVAALGAHLRDMIDGDGPAAADIATERAIGQGVVDGVVHDLRGPFLRELITRGRPVPPHLLALADDGDAA